MTFQPQHLGLFLNDDLKRAVQEQRDTDTISSAFDFLTHARPDTSLSDAQLSGLRYQFLGDVESGSYAINSLQNTDLNDSTHNYRETLQYALASLSVFESVRQHPDANGMLPWLDRVRQQVDVLNEPPDNATLLDGFWLGALNIGAAIVFEDEAYLHRGVDIYQIAIDDHIHPEGYLKGIVDDDDRTDTYRLQVLGTAALVLMAEMGTLAGMDLWEVNNRGTTPITAATYVMYYYYYPEKWKWETGLTSDTTQSIMKQYGAYIEMVNRRSPIRGIDIMFDDQRPLYSLTCGGLTTLTHGTTVPPKKKRWRLFG